MLCSYYSARNKVRYLMQLQERRRWYSTIMLDRAQQGALSSWLGRLSPMPRTIEGLRTPPSSYNCNTSRPPVGFVERPTPDMVKLDSVYVVVSWKMERCTPQRMDRDGEYLYFKRSYMATFACLAYQSSIVILQSAFNGTELWPRKRSQVISCSYQ